MIDHQESRIWANHHEAFSRWVADAIATVAKSLRALRRIQYEAPWRTAQNCEGEC